MNLYEFCLKRDMEIVFFSPQRVEKLNRGIARFAEKMRDGGPEIVKGRRKGVGFGDPHPSLLRRGM